MTGPSSDLTGGLLPGDAERPHEPPWMRDARTQARRYLEEEGLPTGREEDWKYTPVREILGRGFAPAPADQVAAPPVDDAGLAELVGDFGGPRLVFVNGHHHPGLSRGLDGVEGLTVTSLASLVDDTPSRSLDALVDLLGAGPSDGFAALNHAAADDAAVVLVDRATQVEQPVHVVHLAVATPVPVAVHPRTLIHAGAHSEVAVVESYAGWDGRILTNAATTVVVGDGAGVRHHRLQFEGAETVHVGQTVVRQGATSRYHFDSIMLGADIGRSAVVVDFSGEGAEARLDGLYLTTGTQEHDHAATVRHGKSHCSSNQLFKGVVGDHARGSFSGVIVVQPDTVRTEAHQTSRSLLLDKQAQADSRPWLEILADDVICTHGATIGQLDEDALFYLRSRGIPTDRARAILVGAFVVEVVEALPTESVREFVSGRIDEKLDAMGVER